MTDTLIPQTASAHDCPLLVKNMLFHPVADNPDQEIVYRLRHRYTYRDLRNRVHRLANVLTGPDDTRLIMATTALESTPPLRKAPRGTSLIIRRRTASSRRATISWHQSSSDRCAFRSRRSRQ